MISPLNFEKTINLPPQQFKVAIVQVINELIENQNRLEAEVKGFSLKPEENTPERKGGRPSAKTR